MPASRLTSRVRSTGGLGVSLGVAALLLVGCGGSSGPAAPPSGGVGTVIDRQVPSSVASLPLRDAAGHTVTLDSFRGRTVVVSDSMTLCSEDCPLDTANVVAAARAADAAGLTHKTVFLTVTVDPARDDPRHLEAYRKLYDPQHRLPNWLLLTGDRKTIAQLWSYLGVYWHKVPQGDPPDHDWLTGKPLTYDIEHADEVLMFDPSGSERYVVSGHAHVLRSGQVPTTMRGFLNRQGRRHLQRPGAETWTPEDVLRGVSWLTGQRLSGS
ncbi:MAG: SCO family protein [Nocardioides sp.]